MEKLEKHSNEKDRKCKDCWHMIDVRIYAGHFYRNYNLEMSFKCGSSRLLSDLREENKKQLNILKAIEEY